MKTINQLPVTTKKKKKKTHTHTLKSAVRVPGTNYLAQPLAGEFLFLQLE